MKSLLVLGANGVMGRRIVELAKRLMPDTACFQASRSALPSADTRRADVTDLESLRIALAGIHVVINTVGPYVYDPTPLLTACSEIGCHYLDVSEDPAYLNALQQTAARLPKGQAPIHILGGCSTIPGLIQVFAQHWADQEQIARLRISLGLGSDNPFSTTLLYAMLRPLGQMAADGSRYFQELRWKRFSDTAPRLYGRYPSPTDERGIRIGDRVLPAEFQVGMDRTLYSRALWLAAKFLPRLCDRQLLHLCRWTRPLLSLSRKFGTPVGILSLEALDSQGETLAEIEVRAPQNGLNIPSLPSVWAAKRFLEADAPLPSGLLQLDQLFTPPQVTEWLQQEGYRVRFEEPLPLPPSKDPIAGMVRR